MPRPSRSQGRPGTAVIPSGWAEGHRPVVDKTGTAACTIRVPGTVQGWDDTTEQNESTPNAAYYTGSCRVQSLATQARQVTVAGDPETIASHLVVVPATISPATNDLVKVTASGDTLLDGRVLRVVQVVYGSLRFERDLFCVLNDD